jgi:hypothetical protein
MVANNSISGLGSISGAGNINGNPITGYSRSYSLTTANDNDVSLMARFNGNEMHFEYGNFPQYLIDYMPDSLPIQVTVSGLVNGDEAMNGQTFTVERVGNLIIDVNGSFATFLAMFNLNGHLASEKYDHVWNWNY